MTMSCPEVVYQAYYPYLYQHRGSTAGGGTGPASSVAARTTPFPSPFGHQYDRHFNVSQRTAAVAAAASAASALELQQQQQAEVYPSHHSSAGSVSSGPGSPLRAPHKDEDTTGTGGGAGAPRTSSGEGGAADDEDDDEEEGGGGSGAGGGGSSPSSSTSRAQYVSANCVVFTHYTGDVAAVVDEHFSRALSYTADSKSAHLKESSPMSARNFPPSFWNSNYQSSAAATVTSHHTAADLYGDPYHPQAGSDPWHSHYQQYSAAAAHHHHRAVHEYHHHHHHHGSMAAQYGGLLLPPATRLPPHVASHHQYSKPEPWGAPSAAQRLHHHDQTASHTLDSAYSTYPSMAGLEAQVQESSKDLYWF